MIKRCAGVKIPVYCLRSKKGLGSGEFLDLIPFIDWCKEAGLKMIQLDPIHDEEASDFSLDPIYLNIHELAPELDEEIKPVQKVLNQPHLEYRRTYLAKRELLKMLFIMRGQEDLSSKAFERFLKRSNLTGRDEEDLEYFYFVQFHLDRQLHQVVKYAEEQGIFLVGDFPGAIHDPTTQSGMVPLRVWWEEDQENTARYYHTILKQVGEPPKTLPAPIAQQIVQASLNSKSKIVLFPLQDLLAISEELRSPDPANEIKNWRCHIYVEEFLLAKSFAKQIREMVKEAKR